ncbi:MAG: hypothetical protein WC459_03715 [Patescibacteria group bacterium]
MTISASRAAEASKKISIEEKTQAIRIAIKEAVELISSLRIAALEKEIDDGIVRNYQLTFWKKRPLSYSYLSVNSWETFCELKRRNLLNNFLEKYREVGWSVTWGYGYLRFLGGEKIKEKNEIKQQILKLLTEKERRREKLLLELTEVEAEIQILTQSPNSRDTKLLASANL